MQIRQRAIVLAGRTLTGLLAVIALSGCAHNDSTSVSPLPSLRPYSAAANPGKSNESSSELLPLQQYMLMGNDLNTVNRAVTILAQQCMSQKGFNVELPPPTPAYGNMVDLTTRRYTTVASLGDAERYGFKLPPDEDSHPDPKAAILHREITPEEAKALVGPDVPTDSRYRHGCLGVADKKLMANTTSIEYDGLSNSTLISNLNDDPRAVESPTEESDMRKFVNCMKSAGFGYFTDPRDIPSQFPYSEPVTKAEKTAAATQFHCQQSTGVVEAMRQAEIAFELKAIDANPEAFADVKADIAKVVRRATTVVDGK